MGENAKVECVSGVSSNPTAYGPNSPHQLNWRDLQGVIDESDDYQLVVTSEPADEFRYGFAIGSGTEDGSCSPEFH